MSYFEVPWSLKGSLWALSTHTHVSSFKKTKKTKLFRSLKTKLLENSFQGEGLQKTLIHFFFVYTRFFACPLLFEDILLCAVFVHLSPKATASYIADTTKIVLVLTFLGGFQHVDRQMYVYCPTTLKMRGVKWHFLMSYELYIPDVTQLHCHITHMTLPALHSCCCCLDISSMCLFHFSLGFWLVNVFSPLEVVLPPLGLVWVWHCVKACTCRWLLTRLFKIPYSYPRTERSPSSWMRLFGPLSSPTTWCSKS